MIALGVALIVELLVLAVRGLSGTGAGYVGPFALGPALAVVLCLLAVPVAVLTIAATDAVAFTLRALARSLLLSSLPPGADLTGPASATGERAR